MQGAAVILVASAWLRMAAAPVRAQWVPGGTLAAVPIIRDCRETGGDVAISRFDPSAVYLCPVLMAVIHKKNPGAEHFYFVHEFGHIALHTSDEAVADCWAAKTLAQAPNGRRYLSAAITHFRQRPDEYRAGYGTPTQRAEQIERCADEAHADTAP